MTTPARDVERDLSDTLRSVGERLRAVTAAQDAALERAASGNGTRPVVVTLSGVEPERVTWLWPGRIPAGKLTLLVGDPEAGKSTIALDAAARVSTGRAWPDGTPNECGDVLFCTLEDGLGDTVRPRLDAAGADCSRVHSVTGLIEHDDDGHPHERALELPADLPYVENIVIARGVRLLVLDPVKAYVHGGINEWRDADVRRLLGPLGGTAERTGVAVVAILHLTKSPSTPTQYRVSGSIAWAGAARSILLAAPDPQEPDSGRRVLAPLKCSLCKPPATLAYSVAAPDGTRDGPAAVIWQGESAVTARQALVAQLDNGEERSALGEAVNFLEQELADGPRPVLEIVRGADREGITRRTLERARSKLGVRTSPAGFGGPRMLRLPDSTVSATDHQSPPQTDMAETGGIGGDCASETPEQAERRAFQEGA